ncbi:sugar-transfer associated ATP-grasp domain-containing protein [Dongia sp.]|uniref:sugar-transfer associated ATP-grasp domain-containing protein n=1 Tax=Dongia sp. TaxID=1977262 RepID=UPI0035B35611
MAYLRLPFCSPYKLVWPLLKAPKDPAEFIHRAYARYVWQMNGRQVLGRVLVYGLLWPLPFAYLSWKHTRRLGAKVAASTGKSRWRQVWEQFSIALRYSISPKKYYVFELFRPERLERAAAYLARYELKGGLHTFLESRIEQPTRRILNDKAAFFRHCEARGITTMPTYLRIGENGGIERLLPFEGTLPACDLFAKPLKGRGGRGCERWLYQGEGYYRDQNGNTRNIEELLAHFRMLASRNAMLVQAALQAHPDLRDLSVNVLTSCRMMTIRNEMGGFEATHAVFKSSTKPEAIVDNFHKGGIVSRVDMASGRLGAASDAGVGRPCVWFETHPLTGAQIAGRILPHWRETVALVERAHAAFPDRITVGWDVAITDRGPVIIEGNVQSGCDMIQRTHDVPAGIGRLAECYAFHVARAFERGVSTAWKQRKGLV